MGANGHAQNQEVVTLTIDGREVSVPKGTNLIEAARQAEVEIPYYCYHPHLSVPGNCRMCQVEVEGAPKLMIGCHTVAQPGMVVKTHKTSKEVDDAQASTLELLLINHPLDCTVCDQAGHCKLQDYHYQYNARPSRFLEKKVNKVKAQPLGPTVMLDGERCIACTRCVRFCDEITGTSEIGLVNRGDRVEIAVHEDNELSNPLSGTVVDLCPVGALTHRGWRFNTRIWYTNATDSICPGCSTGCNVKVFERDGQVVQVKARLNGEVNKEWLCDQGRYGFQQFLPESRVIEPSVGGRPVEWAEALKAASNLRSGRTLVLLAPDLLLEEYSLVRRFVEKGLTDGTVAVQCQQRDLTSVEAVLISPDYAPNYQGAIFSGVVEANDFSELVSQYEQAVSKLVAGEYENVLLIGDRALTSDHWNDPQLVSKVNSLSTVVAVLTDQAHSIGESAIVLPGRSILEKQGLLVNRSLRLQYNDRSVDFPAGSEPEWRVIARLAEQAGEKLTEARSDRDLTRWYLSEESRLKGLSIRRVKGGGVDLKSFRSDGATGSEDDSRRQGTEA